MEDIRDRLKGELKALADTTLEDAKRALEELKRYGYSLSDIRLESARCGVKPRYINEIVSKLKSSFPSILKRVDEYCLELGLRPKRLSIYLENQLGFPYEVKIDSVQKIVGVVDGLYDFKRSDQEIETKLREEIYKSLTDCRQIIDNSRIWDTEPASQPGQGEEKAIEPPKITKRLRLISETKEAYWEGHRKEEVNNLEFYALWLLAKRPYSTVKNVYFYELFKDSRGNADIYLSRLIRGRNDRKSGLKYHFPEIEQLIETQESVGYYLKLSLDEIELVGDDPEDLKEIIKEIQE